MNPAAVLSLLGDLYIQIEALLKENEGLKAKQRESDLAAARPDPLAGPEEAIAQARKESERGAD